LGDAGSRAGTHLSSPAEGDYFDRLVEASGDFNPFTARGWNTLARRYAAAVPDRALRLLDVGCGTGSSAAIYHGRCDAYVGLDLSLTSLRLACRRLATAGFTQADAQRLPFAAGSLDVVAFSSVLHHLPDRRAALAEAHRVLAPGGWCFAFDPNLLHPAMLIFRHPSSPFYSSHGVSPGERPLLPRVLRADFTAAGFGELGQRGQSDIPYRRVAPRGLDALLPLYNRIDWLWEAIGLGRRFGTFVVTWGRKR